MPVELWTDALCSVDGLPSGVQEPLLCQKGLTVEANSYWRLRIYMSNIELDSLLETCAVKS